MHKVLVPAQLDPLWSPIPWPQLRDFPYLELRVYAVGYETSVAVMLNHLSLEGWLTHCSVPGAVPSALNTLRSETAPSLPGCCQGTCHVFKRGLVRGGIIG